MIILAAVASCLAGLTPENIGLAIGPISSGEAKFCYGGDVKMSNSVLLVLRTLTDSLSNFPVTLACILSPMEAFLGQLSQLKQPNFPRPEIKPQMKPVYL